MTSAVFVFFQTIFLCPHFSLQIKEIFNGPSRCLDIPSPQNEDVIYGRSPTTIIIIIVIYGTLNNVKRFKKKALRLYPRYFTLKLSWNIQEWTVCRFDNFYVLFEVKFSFRTKNNVYSHVSNWVDIKI